MNRIAQLHINNFKFFGQEKPIELDGKHLLLYGENGSGKSTIFWSLYTLFEAAIKNEDDDIRKYFRKGDKEFWSLVNVHAQEVVPGDGNYDSFIQVTTDNKDEQPFRIALDDVALRGREDARKVNYASDFIQYKLLQSLHSFWHRDPIDLFHFFVDHTLQHVQFDEVSITRNGTLLKFTNAFDIWKQILQGPEWTTSKGKTPKAIRVYKGSPQYIEFEKLVVGFNQGMEKLLAYVNAQAGNFLERLGYTTFKFHLEYSNASFVKKDIDYKAVAFKVALVISEYEGKKNVVHRAHSFLNEAKLSAMGIAIRLAVLYQKLKHDGLKFIVLDDLLISLDMRNREKVLDLFLSEEFVKNYQLLILTHDQHFFQMAKHKIKRAGQTDWVYLEMFQIAKSGVSAPLMRPSLTYIEQADVQFTKKNYDGAGNFMRKAAEEFCKEFVPVRLQVDKNFDKLDTSGLLDACIKYAKNNNLNHALFQDLQDHREFIFNALSHDSYDVPRFRDEIDKCFDTFQHLHDIKFKTIFEKGADTELYFEMTDKDGKTVYRAELTVYDELRLIKEPKLDAILTRGLMLQKQFQSGNLFSSQYQQDSIKRFYDNWFNTSDKKGNPDFWDGVIVKATGQPLRSLKTF